MAQLFSLGPLRMLACITISDWIQLSVGVGTILVAWAAIFGARMNNRFLPARLQITVHNPKGQLEEHPQYGPTHCFHLLIRNTKPWIPITRTRILLRAASRLRRGASRWEEIIFPVARQFVWAPSEHAPKDLTVSDAEVLDFGSLSRGRDFTPTFYPQGGSLDVRVSAGDTLRYVIELQADGYYDKHVHVAEVQWDGVFPQSRDDVPEHLKILLTSKKRA